MKKLTLNFLKVITLLMLLAHITDLTAQCTSTAMYTYNFCGGGTLTVGGTITHVITSSSVFNDTLTGAGVNGCDSIVISVVSVGTAPAQVTQISSRTLCNGSASGKIAFSVADTTTFASWRSSNPSIGLTSHGVDTIPAFTAVNNGNTPITDTITVTVKGRGYAWFPSGPWLIKYDIARHVSVDTISMPHSDIALQCAFSPDGSVVYVYSRQTGTVNRSIYAFSTGTGQLVRTYPYRDQINNYHQGEMCISPDGQYLYVASSFGNLNLFVINTVTGAVKSNIVVAAGRFYGICISPDGSRIYAAGGDVIPEIDAHADTLIRTIATGYNSIKVAISPDGKTLFSSNLNGIGTDTIHAIDIASGNFIAAMPTNNLYAAGQVDGYFFTPDSTKLGVFGSIPGTGASSFNIYDLKTYALVGYKYCSILGAPAILIGNQPADDSTILLNLNISPDGRELFEHGTFSIADPFGLLCLTYPGLNLGPRTQNLYYDHTNQAGSQGSFMDAGHCLSQEMTFTITVLPAGRDTQYTRLCNGDTVIIGGRKYATAGAFSDTLHNAAVNGCDSIFTMVVGVGYPSRNTNSLYICQGQTISVGQYHHSSTGIYTDTLISSFGCDSVITTHLSVSNLPLAPSAISNQQHCPGDVTTAVSFSGSGANVIYSWTGSSTSTGLAGSGTGPVPAFTTINNGSLVVNDTITVSAAQHGFVYVPESSGNLVKVIDGSADTLITTVPTGAGPLGVAISLDGSRVYVGNANDSTITVINGIYNTVTDTIHAVDRVFGLCMSPDGSKLYASCYGSDSVCVINTATNTVTGIIPGMNGPTGVCISPDGSKLYVCNSGTNTVSVISTSTNSVTATVPVGAYPYGIAISPDGSTVYVANLDDTSLSVISTASNNVTADINVGPSPRCVSAGPDGSRVYVSNAIAHAVYVINTSNNTITDTINAYHVTGVSVSPDGGLLYVVCSDTTSVINTATNTVLTTIPLVGTTAGTLGQLAGPARCSGPVTKFTITVNPNKHDTIYQAICQAALPYVWNGLTFTGAGTQTKTGLTSAAGCDSSATLNLTVNQPTSSNTNFTICQSALPYVWNGLTFTGAGSQTKTGLTNANGCDSTATLNLTVNVVSASTTNLAICASVLPYVWNGLTFNAAGSQTQTGLTTALGCDSTATLNLTVKQASSSNNNLTICASALPYSWNGLTFTSGGSQTKTGLTNAAGCDSTATLNLTVNQASTSNTSLSICASALPYSWNGLTFTAAGSQTKTGFTNAAGCDSSATLNLTVNQPTSSNTNYTICQSALPYVWNGLTFTGAGSQTKTGLTNANGCDSTATLNLIVNTVSASTTNLAVCASALPYTWNGLTFTGAGSQTKTGLTTALGCDSTATLNLTVKQASSSTNSLSICPSALPYSWNGLTFTAAGSQTATGLTNAAGCDSSATLNLTVNAASTSTNNLSICNNELPYSWNGLTFTSAGSQTATGFTNAAGCDSTATLNLSVNAIDTSVSVALTVLTANQAGATYQWIDCSNNQQMAGATSASYTAPVTGDYAVAITKNSCTDTSECVHVVVTGLPAITGDNVQIEVYPNPNNGSFIIHGAGAGTCTITNELGQLIKTFNLTSANYTVNINDLSSGVYFVACSKGAETFTKKVVVLK